MALSDLITALAAATGPGRLLDCRLHQMFWPDDEVLLDPGSVRECRPATFGKLKDFPMDGWAPAFCDTLARHIGAPAYTSSLDAITGALEQRWPGVKWSADNGGWATIETEMHFKAVGGYQVKQSPALSLCLAAARLAAAEE